MKVYVGTMYRIIVERKCGCRAAQEFKDSAMREPDGDPTYKPCTKHKRGTMNEVVQEFMLEVLENKAEEHRSKTSIAIAETNATRTEAPPPSVGEGSASETHIPIKVGNKVVQRPATQAAASAVAAPTTPAGRRDFTKPRQANLATGSSSGLRHATQPKSVADVVTAKTASAAAAAGNSIDDELSGVSAPAAEDERITKHLVDADGGLLGSPLDDPSEDRSI